MLFSSKSMAFGQTLIGSILHIPNFDSSQAHPECKVKYLSVYTHDFSSIVRQQGYYLDYKIHN